MLLVICLPAAAQAEDLLLLPFRGDKGGTHWKRVTFSLRRAKDVTLVPLTELDKGGEIPQRTTRPEDVVRWGEVISFKVALVAEWKEEALRWALVRPDGSVARSGVAAGDGGRISGLALRQLSAAVKRALAEDAPAPPPQAAEASATPPAPESPEPAAAPPATVTATAERAAPEEERKPVEAPPPAPRPPLAAGGQLGLRAGLAEGRLAVDGAADEPAWAAAAPFQDFRRTEPPLKTPPPKTELRILFDDRNLYLFVDCTDDEPEKVITALGPRDNAPASDKITVMIDPEGDRRTAYYFGLSAGGVKEDGLLYEDVSSSNSWDGEWEGAARRTATGWSAELRIPLHLLRLSGGVAWGFNLRRVIGRTHEIIDSSEIPWNGRTLVARFNRLTGVEALTAPNAFSFVPFIAARASLLPLTEGAPRTFNPSADLGIDMRVTLPKGLNLLATANPDFSEVTPDDLILNLTTVEVFRPEKRPFFNETEEKFQPLGAEAGWAPHALFYSRRIGATAPILTAVMLTGPTRPGEEVTLLDAVVMGPGKLELATQPVWRAERPFHVGLNEGLPDTKPLATNYFAGVIKEEAGDHLSLAAMATEAHPLEDPCPASGTVALNPCPITGSTAAALNWDLHSLDREWRAYGQLSMVRFLGDSNALSILQDGTEVRGGDLGAGLDLRGGKLGGGPFQWSLQYHVATPKLDLNQVGFMEHQNWQQVTATAHLSWPIFGLKDFELRFYGRQAWPTNGIRLTLERVLVGEISLLTQSHLRLSLLSAWNSDRNDLREIPQKGIPVQRGNMLYTELRVETDPSRAFFAAGKVYINLESALGGRITTGGFLFTALRPHPQFELSLRTETDVPESPRYIGEDGDQLLFARFDSRFLVLTLAQTLTLTPSLSFQLAAQLFTAFGLYGDVYSAPIGPRVLLSDLTPTTLPEGNPTASFLNQALRITAVLRWEYRIGSSVSLVYSRSQDGFFPNVQQATLLPGRLPAAPASDTVQLKLSYAADL